MTQRKAHPLAVAAKQSHTPEWRKAFDKFAGSIQGEYSSIDSFKAGWEAAEVLNAELITALNDISHGMYPPELTRKIGSIPLAAWRDEALFWMQQTAKAAIAKATGAA